MTGWWQPCASRFNRQDDHQQGCAAGPSTTWPSSELPPPSRSSRCPSTRPRPPSWWQQQRWRCSRRGLACSSSSPSGDESFGTCLEHTWNVLMPCSPVRMAGLATLQPVLFGRALFGACGCHSVSTRVVQTCAVTCHRSCTTYPSRPPSLEERVGRVRVWSDQGHS